MNIDEMQAGREMDCLIAEKIFKWEDADWNCEVHCHTGRPPNRCSYEKVLDYSTDIAAAWEVFMKFTGSSICQRNRLFEAYIDGQPYSLTYAETAPLAICRAALKALEV